MKKLRIEAQGLCGLVMDMVTLKCVVPGFFQSPLVFKVKKDHIYESGCKRNRKSATQINVYMH